MRVKLSHDNADLRPRYGVVIIGSGYGGAITAARLAAAGHDVCVLERGKEWTQGSFPRDGHAAFAELRCDENPTGLFDIIRGDDLDIVSGNGLGGTSLINANIVVPPADHVLQHPRWPRVIRQEAAAGALQRYYDLVADMLAITEAPPSGVSLAKTAAHRRSASGRPGAFTPLPVAVNFDRYVGEPNHVGVVQDPCTLCGNCVTGCNVGAKNTLTVNYLPLARQSGAAIFTRLEVDYVLPARVADDGADRADRADRVDTGAENPAGYHVFATYHPEGGEPRRVVVHARAVVLAAGVMGTLGILFRSRLRGLRVSRRLGHHISGNGNLIGVGYNTDRRTDAAGLPRDGRGREYPVGPTITSMIDYRRRDTRDQQFVIEEGAMPRALIAALRRAMPTAALLEGDDTDDGMLDKAGEVVRVIRDLVRDDPRGAVNHSMIYLGTGHDGADGRARLSHDGRARLVWGELPDRPVLGNIGREMRALVGELGGTYIPSPWGVEYLGDNEITVHPLGGCTMADDRSGGVVDHIGRVFDPRGDHPAAVHRDLYVADGSVIPTSIGVNPMFTISALAERIAERFNRSHPVAVRPDRRAVVAPVEPAVPAGLEFTEHVGGHITAAVTDAHTPAQYVAAERMAREGGSTPPHSRLDFRLSLVTEDLAAFLDSPRRRFAAAGHIDAPLFGGRRAVERGWFELLVPASAADEGDNAHDGGDREHHDGSDAGVPTAGDDGRSRRMRYWLEFRGHDGQRYTLDGFKIIRDDLGADLWADTTTLYTSVRAGWSRAAPVVAQGVLRVSVEDFLAQLTTYRIRHCEDPAQAARWFERFGAFFFGELWDVYIAARWHGARRRVA